MTLDEMMTSDKTYLAPSDVAPLLGCHPYSINEQAHEDITKLGFPCALVKTRVKIPRIGFLRWFLGGEPKC